MIESVDFVTNYRISYNIGNTLTGREGWTIEKIQKSTVKFSPSPRGVIFKGRGSEHAVDIH